MSIRNFFKGALLLSLLSASSVLFAQEQGYGKGPRKSPQERALNQTQMMQKNLSLTADQNKKVYEINLKHAAAMDKLMDEPKGEGKRSEMQGINAQKDGDLKQVLTAEQFQKYQAMVQEMKEKRRERGGGGNGGGQQGGY
jgi:Spy/CpxP family protein refolding chaperone